MKKTAKSILLMLVMAVMLVALTACGGNKLVAIKEYSEDDSFFGAYTETIEIKFKNDVADKVTMTMEFEDKDKAEAIASVYKLAGDEMEGVETKTSGKKFIMTMDADYDRVRWYGSGPEETYADRKHGGKMGLYENRVEENMAAYLRPQECGNKCDVRRAWVMDRSGRGLMFWGDELSFSALPYTPHDWHAGNW